MKTSKYIAILSTFVIVLAVVAVIAYKNSQKTTKQDIVYEDSQTETKQSQEENYKVVDIFGGLGNQMFQYAFGLALANESNCEVYYDLSHYGEDSQLGYPTVEDAIKDRKSAGDHNIKREFCLKYFNTTCKKATEEQIKECTTHASESIIREKGIDSLKTGKKEHIAGNFETLELFDYEKYRDLFSKEFSLKVEMDEKNKNMLNSIKQKNSIAIHIRRTDHGRNLGYTGMEYYHKAVEYIASKIKDPHFFIFSDDIGWVKDNFKIDYPFTIVDINNDSTNYFDFELMKNCKNHIIANSTFSWWAAWLNPNKGKIVIAPTPWFKDDIRDNMIPKDWIRMQDSGGKDYD